VAGFDFFRSRRAGFSPRTPAAALKAIGTGTLPVEHFVYASASAKPLDEEPFDLEEIERATARTDVTLETSLMLKRVLSKLIGSNEQETALFGAEGITLLETRAMEKVQRLKALPQEQRGQEEWRALAHAYFELAELHGEAASVRSFYLGEAHACLREAGQRGESTLADLTLAVDTLVALGLHAQADQALDEARDAEDPAVTLLSARVAFHRRDYRRVAACCRRLAAARGSLGEKDARIVAFWAGLDG
jgi:hypothetical protein